MKKFWMTGAAAIALILGGCGGSGEENTKTGEKKESAVETEVSAEQTLSYLGKDYLIPGEVDSIVAASLESMEDSAVLGIKPAGVLEVAGEIPGYLAEELKGAELIGDKRAPNAEGVLSLEPDVIVGTSKWGEDVMAEMNKIATTIPYSHISTDWKDNLTALAAIGDKTDEAAKIIADYDKKAAEAKAQVAEEVADETVLIVRVRGGLMYVYPQSVYLNPVLYDDLGAKVPEIVQNAKAQEEITMETLASINPDAIFLQFEESENTDAPTALEDLKNDPIFSSLKASQNGRVFINTISPMAQGGTAWSKVKFLDAAVESLLN